MLIPVQRDVSTATMATTSCCNNAFGIWVRKMAEFYRGNKDFQYDSRLLFPNTVEFTWPRNVFCHRLNKFILGGYHTHKPLSMVEKVKKGKKYQNLFFLIATSTNNMYNNISKMGLTGKNYVSFDCITLLESFLSFIIRSKKIA